MCGLAGFANVTNLAARIPLAYHLGIGADDRGGHAAGYVSASLQPGSPIHYGRTLGRWGDTSRAFMAAACAGDLTILHARYATMGRKDVASNAHPFAIKRDGRTVLWGAHNGMIEGTHATARAHGREHTVDSRELFELLADGKLDALRALQGYGVLTWIERVPAPGAARCVRMVRLTDDAELVVARTECGAIVWASTWEILAPALQAAGMVADVTFTIDTGKVYEAHADGRFTYSHHPNLTLRPRDYGGARYRSAIDYTRDWRAEGLGDLGEFDALADDCPVCQAWDTYAFDGEAQCADCGASWPYATPDAPDAWDGAAWERWIADERRKAREDGPANGATSCT